MDTIQGTDAGGRAGHDTGSALSIYGGQGPLDDFPVLKAFQQYVDGEQAKAHKRLVTVCFFFTMLILTMIGVFMFIIMNMRNADPSTDATLKALSENNSALQRQVLDQTVRMNEQLIAQITAKSAQAPSAPQVDLEIQRRNLELQAKLNAMEIEKRLRAEQEAEAARRKKELDDQMTEDEKLSREEKIRKNEKAQKTKEKKLKELEEKLANEEKLLKERERQLWLRKQYPDSYRDLPDDVDDGEYEDDPPAKPAPAANPAPAPSSAPAAKPAVAPARPANPPPRANANEDKIRPRVMEDGSLRYFDDEEDDDLSDLDFLDHLDEIKSYEVDDGNGPISLPLE